MNKLIDYLKELYNQGFGLSIEYWLIIFFTIFLYIFIGLKVNGSKQNSDNKTSLFYKTNLSVIRILSCIIGIIVFISLILFIFFYKKYFLDDSPALDILLLVFILGFIEVYLIIKMSSGVKQRLPKYITPPLSISEKVIHAKHVRNNFDKSKWKVLCLVVPFLILSFHSIIKYKAEVSIVIDNSGSTDMLRKYGQYLFANAIKGTYEDTRFNISYFNTYSEEFQCRDAFNNLKTSTDEIIRQTNPSSLNSNNITISQSQPAASYIRNQEIENSCIGTPLLETIWSNFLFSLNVNSSEKDVTRILILLTDGKGNLYSENNKEYQHKKVAEDFDIFKIMEINSNTSMYDYFDEISIINIGENYEEGLFKNFQSIIYDGQNKESYENTLKIVTKRIQKRNWYFIYLLASLIFIVSLVFVFTNLHPKIN